MPENSETIPTPKNPVYLSPTPGKITIAAFYPFVATSSPATAICKDLKDCGFNSAIINVRDSADKIALTACALYGIHPFFHDPRLAQSENTCKDFISAYVSHDNDGNPVAPDTRLGGWMLTDDATPADVRKGSSLANAIGWIREYDPFHPLFIGLTASADFSTIAGITYRQYIEDFEYNLSPSLWPYRYFTYPDSTTATAFSFANFYKGLETLAFMARYTNVPIWSYVKALTRTGGTPPTEAQMRLEAFSALAFGAQGIVYWAYKQRPNTSEVYPSALVDRNGNKMPAWYFAKQVNHEILQYSKVFVNSELIGWAHTGESYGGPSIGSGSFGAILSIKTSGTGALVTQLKTNDHNYMVIVSHDVEEYQTVDLTFVPTVIYELTPLTSYGEHGKETQLKSRTIKRELIPGGYLIYEFKGGAS